VHPVDITSLIEMGALLYGSALVAERAAAVGDAVVKGVDGLDPIVASIIGRAADYTAADAYRAEYEVARLRSASAAIWDEIDVLALPTTPIVPTRSDVADDPFGTNVSIGALTTFVNLADLAAIVVPDLDETGRPVGLQLVGPAWSDDELARLALGLDHGRLASAPTRRTLVVVGAHLAGLPLNHQLTERRATLVGAARTSPDYRLFALSGTVPPKPGLLRVAPGTGTSIDVEVWSLGDAELGSFVAQVPPPLCIGTIVLADGSTHLGFLCEPEGLRDAVDISDHGGWRSYLASRT
jgi:allophanate hydrolase